ncbi:acyclic terpene utilization AtuA family protein [Paracoccus aminophilus]|uniref:Acyclic terpene utilisation N-terminal domain-containing protein n=1 Tax=Paracoccus aminophilus JCM 7686 TaxID=1367847 RepID=S5YUD5_PARAH|nr:acyclic terpene utilization AtuA family protein [Paracoccus aminophilus]AGT08856.1 hypothetical protein JCM7686_1755 [Paracoccus aminophilus JCM 7686]
MRTIRLGAGAGYSGDRIDPAVDLVRRGALDYLIFECLAERTIALAQLERRRDPESGFDPLLVRRMEAILPEAARRATRIITNMGAASPRKAAERVAEVARDLGLSGLKIAAVDGDDVLETVLGGDWPVLEHEARVADYRARIISANAYLGVGGILSALAQGADVIITGRVADAALYLAPMIHEFGWALGDWDRLAQGTLVGHLLECAGQISGGYFADPGVKDVPGLDRLGFPLAEVSADGTAVITKLPETGGQISLATCKEQLLYEVHDPESYLQPDLVADFSSVEMEELGPDRIRISGARGKAATGLLKVSIGYEDSWLGEGQMSYGGVSAVGRARLAQEIIRQRLAQHGAGIQELKTDLIGLDALGARPNPTEPPEVRLRVIGRTATEAEARLICEEVEALYTNGPAGGGGARKSVTHLIGVISTLIPEARVVPAVTMLESL